MDDPNHAPATLDYASPPPPVRRHISTRSRFIGVVRQLVFAIGLACLCAGFGGALMQQIGSGWIMGFGGLLVGLAWKFRRGDRL